MALNLPPSIFGARCDVLMDIVVLCIAIILPLLWYSMKKVKHERDYKLHKKIQLYMFIILFFVVQLFEYEMQANGGIFEMVKGSSYEGTFFLNFMIYFHTFLSITTCLIWIILIIASLIKFDKNPKPNKLSKTHKFWGTHRYVGHGIDLYHRVDTLYLRIRIVSDKLLQTYILNSK